MTLSDELPVWKFTSSRVRKDSPAMSAIGTIYSLSLLSSLVIQRQEEETRWRERKMRQGYRVWSEGERDGRDWWGEIVLSVLISDWGCQRSILNASKYRRITPVFNFLSLCLWQTEVLKYMLTLCRTWCTISGRKATKWCSWWFIPRLSSSQEIEVCVYSCPDVQLWFALFSKSHFCCLGFKVYF